MTKIKTYHSAKDFRTALESRIRTIGAKEDIEIPKLRIQVSFDRLLARLFNKKKNPWLLKGGYAMQLRIKNARATKDIDLAMKEMPFLSDSPRQRNIALLELVQKAALLDLNDFFNFKILLPRMELEGAPEGGARFPVEVYMDNRIFSKFNLDIGIGDIWIEPETITTRPWLDFVGIGSEDFPIIPKEQHFAEKLHAYTRPRGEGRTSSRVKDLVDMVLLIDNQNLKPKILIDVISATFQNYGTHEFSQNLLPPPQTWGVTFAGMAKECDLESDNLDFAFKTLQDFVKKLPQPNF